MQKVNILDIYTDYLLCCPSLKTATELSVLLDKEVSHDKITRYLSSGELSSKTLWLYVKPIYKQVASEDEDGVLIIDDSVVEKKYTDRNEIINWHYSHTECRHIKGVNFMSCIYHTPKINLPVMIEFVRKDKKIVDKRQEKLNIKAVRVKTRCSERWLRNVFGMG